nr:Gfo/Idh/MocA family oxidoreductase [Microbacterium yannicii]
MQGGAVTVSGPPPVRIGVVGAGFMGRQHIDFVRASTGAALAAIADPAVTITEAACPTYPSTARMLDAEQLDAVIVANPNALHVDTAVACLEAGVAVLLEKPVAVSYAQSRRLVDAVERLNGRLLVGHHRRHHLAVARARAAIGDGELGQVVAVTALWSARKEPEYFIDTPWHSQPGAGVTLINAVHDLDLLRHLCGEVAEVQAMQSSHARGLEVEDTISLTLRFENGALGSLLASDAGVSPWGWDQATEETPAFPFLPDEVAYRIVGTRAALSVPNLARYGYDASVPPDWHSPLSRTYLPVTPRASFPAQLDHFLEVARGTTAPLVSADDASRTLALVEAAALAARSGRTVDVRRFQAAAQTDVAAHPDDASPDHPATGGRDGGA